MKTTHTQIKRWCCAIVHTFLPALLSLLLFGLGIFWIVLPEVETQLMENKKLALRELSLMAWIKLSQLHAAEMRGELTREQAQELAKQELATFKYGRQRKGYFWLNDIHAQLIMHPYRAELVDKDLSIGDYTAEENVLKTITAVATNRKKGFVNYSWSSLNNPNTFVPKTAHIRLFEPWGWVVGTGSYTDQVATDIKTITHKLRLVSGVIFVILFILCTFIVWQNLRSERLRVGMQNQLENANQQLRDQNIILQESQAELMKREEQLLHADKMFALGTLVSGVAHEINNPNHFIMLNTSMLQKMMKNMLPILDDYYRQHGDFYMAGSTYAQVRESIPELVQGILGGSRRIKTIIDSLRDFAREGPADMTQSVSINDVVKEAITLVENLIKRSTDQFFAEFDESLPTITGNAQRIEQVIINLIQNACQSIQDKHAKIHIRTTHSKAFKGIRVEIIDEGIGIPDHIKTRITDPFFTTRRESGGTGLGLSVSAGIIEDHKGHLHFESQLHRGTIAIVELPLRRE